MTNIFGPGAILPTGFVGMQNELIDLRSRENSSVKSFFHNDWMAWLHSVPSSFFDMPDLLMLNAFIFSQRIVSAVSVASPTFSYTPFDCIQAIRNNVSKNCDTDDIRGDKETRTRGRRAQNCRQLTSLKSTLESLHKEQIVANSTSAS